eukprot:587751-Pyramimonas_sp.AAC.1
MDGEEWVQQNDAAKSMGAGQSGYAVASWARAAREASRRLGRVRVGLRLFAGERRGDDARAQLGPRCEEAGMELLLLSADSPRMRPGAWPSQRRSTSC